MHGVYLNSNPSEMTPKLLWLLLNISYVILNLKKSNCFEENKSECVRALLRPVLKLKIFYDLFSLTYRDALRLSFMLDWVQSVAVYQLHMIAWWEKYVLCVSFTDQHRKLHEHLRLTEWNETIPLWLYYIHTQRYKDKRKHTYRTPCTGAPWGNIHCIHMTFSNLRSAVFCTLCCLCPLDAGWWYMSLDFSMWSLEWCQKKWRMIFPKAPHRVQSHYRPCQIQLDTEFAAQERGGERQDGEG